MESIQCHQVDEAGIYIYTVDRARPAARQVIVPLPVIPTGHLARWESALHPYSDAAWATDGQWQLYEDHRSGKLYTQAGEYELGKDFAGATYDGVGPLPVWLSDVERPSAHHDLVDGNWVLDEAAALASAKSEKLLQINAARDAAIAGGFEHAGHTYDSDSKSIQRISAIATLALMDPQYSTPYITAENSIVTLDAAAIAALGVAAAQHESGLVFYARLLKDQVQAAETLQQVAAIAWNSQEAVQ